VNFVADESGGDSLATGDSSKRKYRKYFRSMKEFS
jgi:hypothetical protein